MPAEDAILSDLNPPQREAVETLSGPLLIVAGAGSGKTRVVTRRIANLIAHGVRPWEVLAITFTNKAAQEMRRRVEDLVGSTSGVWLSTFHSFCARLLRREAPVLGLSPDFSIYDEDDALGVLGDVVKALNLEDKRYSARSMRVLISRLKARGETPEDLTADSHRQRLVQEIYERYEETLRRNQGLDFDDLLLKARGLLRDHPEARARIARRFRHVLVDEYQDTNGCQYDLVKLLGQEHRNVCVTGDPDQSIYAWRGADVRNILSFEKDFPEAKVVRLEQNYRSTKQILSVANALIRHNTERQEKNLWTENPAGERARLVVSPDGELEAYEVASTVKRLLTGGRRPEEMAVFYRTNAQSRPFENALLQAAIPYRLVGGTPFYERREVKDALAYLRLLVNPRDEVSFRRAAQTPKRGVGEKMLDQIAQDAAAAHVSMLELLDQPNWIEQHAGARAREGLSAFARLFDGLRRMPPYPVAAVLRQALEESGLIESLEAAGEDERLENLEQLVNAATVFDAENDPEALKPAGPPPEPGAYDGMEELVQRQASVSGFLENAALVQPTDGLDDTNRVTLMTLHMAKGLEFPFVFIAGLEDGLLPLVRGSNPSDREAFDEAAAERALEEERRLFYVGVTRAREQVYLLRANMRMRYGKTDWAVPSRFLDEIPAKLLETPRGGTSPRTPFAPRWSESPLHAKARSPVPWDDSDETAAPRRRAAERTAAPNRPRADHEPALPAHFADESQLEESDFEVGDQVIHPNFGAGTIESLSGRGLSRKARIHFRKGGMKTLLLSMARLRKK